MSFVSVLANTEVITLVSDGRVSDQLGNSTQENYKKFKKISDKQFIAFAGSKQPCEAIIEQIDFSDNMYDLSQVSKEIYRAIKENEELKKFNLLFIVGGINQYNEIEFYGINANDHQLEQYKPSYETEFKYAFLHNGDDNVDLDIESKIVELKQRHGTSSINKLLRIQKDLNNYVAEHDPSVNKITHELKLRKTRT